MTSLSLTSNQRKYLRGLAHPLKPVVLIGSRGFTPGIAEALDEALLKHELVKIKFNDDKSKSFKSKTIAALEEATGAQVAGVIGHIAIYYRPHPKSEKRKVSLPS